MKDEAISRRRLLKRAGALGVLTAFQPLLVSCLGYPFTPVPRPSASSSTVSGEQIDLVISEQSFALDGRTGKAVTINGTIPGPLIRLKEGQEVTLRVTNRLKEVFVDSLARHSVAFSHGWRARGQFQRHCTGRHVHLSISGQAERNLLVSQPFRRPGIAGHVRDDDSGPHRAGALSV